MHNKVVLQQFIKISSKPLERLQIRK